MECPYCGGSMEPGTVSARRDPLFWCPEGEEANFFTTRGGVNRRGGFCVVETLSKTEAWYCQSCNQLTVFNAK